MANSSEAVVQTSEKGEYYYQRVGYVSIMDKNGNMVDYGKSSNGVIDANALDFKFRIKKPVCAMCVEASISILGLSRETMLNLSSWYPYNMAANLKRKIEVYAGYADTGVKKLFSGYIIDARITQPPNMWLNIKANNLAEADAKLSKKTFYNTKFHTVVKEMAEKLGLKPQISSEVSDKTIRCARFDGANSDIPSYLQSLHSVRVFTDDIGKKLVVEPWMPKNVPSKEKSQTLNYTNGLIGLPDIKFTEMTAHVRLDTNFERAGYIWLESYLYPEDAKGSYWIHTIEYNGHLRGQEWESVIHAWNISPNANLQSKIKSGG